MANICFVSLKIECRSKRAAIKVNAVLMQLKEAADQQRKGFYAGSDRYIFDAAFYVYEKEVSMAYWVKWGYSDEEVITLIKFLNEITPIKSLRLYLRRRRQSGVWRIHLFCRNSFLPGTSCFALSRCNRQRFRSGTPATGI